MEKKFDSVMVWIVAVIIGIFSAIVSILINGFVLSYLWLWFIALQFGIRPLTLAQAVGFGMVVSFSTHQFIPNKNPDNKILFVYAFVRPFTVLLFGWVIFHFFL